MSKVVSRPRMGHVRLAAPSWAFRADIQPVQHNIHFLFLIKKAVIPSFPSAFFSLASLSKMRTKHDQGNVDSVTENFYALLYISVLGMSELSRSDIMVFWPREETCAQTYLLHQILYVSLLGLIFKDY